MLLTNPPEPGFRRIIDYIGWISEAFVAAGLYYGHGTDNAQDEAISLLFHVIGIEPPYDDDVLEQEVPESAFAAIVDLARQRIDQRKPLPYLIKQAWFAGLPFYVDERVIVPRSPFAELIHNEFRPWHQNLAETRQILDLCCGSGCIGIAAAHLLPDAEVDLVDISSDALTVAQINIAKHHLQERCNAVNSNGFEQLRGRQYDLILSNPPYVDKEDFQAMPEEYHCEPQLALVSGDDGLDLTRRILREAADFLTDEGSLFVEVGNSWVALEEAFPTVPFTWLDFEHGGHGVFVLTKQQLLENAQAFAE